MNSQITVEQSYVLIANQAYEDVVRYAELRAEDKWKLYDKQSEFTTYTRYNPGEYLRMNLTTAIAPVPIMKLVEILKEADRRREYDDKFECGSTLQVIDEVTRITYMRIIPGMLLSKRDAVMLTKAFINKEDGTVVIIAKSIFYEGMPPQHSYVRADVIIGAWVLKPINENTTNVVAISLVDPKGYIPKTLFNLSSRFQGDQIKKLIKVVSLEK